MVPAKTNRVGARPRTAQAKPTRGGSAAARIRQGAAAALKPMIRCSRRLAGPWISSTTARLAITAVGSSSHKSRLPVGTPGRASRSTAHSATAPMPET